MDLKPPNTDLPITDLPNTDFTRNHYLCFPIMKKVAFYTLGCKLNYSETSTISRKFEEKGFQKVDFSDRPDIFIINTCSVTENADKKCRKIVREARAISPDGYIAIIGCYAQLKPKEISEIPGVDAVLGAAEKFRLLELLDGFERQPQPQVFASDIDTVNTFNTSYSMHDRTRTFLKVQDGCDYSCSFCTIPLARGSSRSDTIKNIVETAGEIAKTEVKEIVLTGVNTGDFGIQEGHRSERFIELVKALDEVEGIERFRISSIEPNLLNDDIIEWVAGSKRFVPHFHIPLQSGSNKILKLMRRRYQREGYASRVEKIKGLMPHCCIGVDVIVGFPGETREDFLETYEFLNGLDISYLHVFPYSERDHTLAAAMPHPVPIKERQERSKMLLSLSDKKRRAFYEWNAGREATVLFENDVENGQMHGFTENYVRISAKYDPLLINELKKVRLVGIHDNGLMAVEEAVSLEYLEELHPSRGLVLRS
jgi:threonylcarbamoyladenosine tRNA methylthiotransferase MtaB